MRFVDTSYWVAFHRRRETHHEQARALWLADAGPVVTSELVRRNLDLPAAPRVTHRGRAVPGPDRGIAAGRVFGVDGEIVGRAWQWLRRHDERVYSFVDAVSFELMRSNKIREALAFDDDFTAAGFVELRQ